MCPIIKTKIENFLSIKLFCYIMKTFVLKLKKANLHSISTENDPLIHYQCVFEWFKWIMSLKDICVAYKSYVNTYLIFLGQTIWNN